jgi:glycosyltransferase involved in cell wall biosynthesis
MKISVIIPTYKPQDYIWECLDSLIKQTFSCDDFEIILVLNGCNNPWQENIEKYVEKNMRGMNVQFFISEMAGVSNARNLGLDNAKGEYVTFIDDDDLVSPDYLKELYECASYHVIPLSYSHAFNDGDIKKQLPYRLTNKYDDLCSSNTMPFYYANPYFSGPCMKLIHRNLIGDKRFDVRFSQGEDSLYMFLLSDNFDTVCFTSRRAIYYRRYREGSATFHKQTFLENLKHMMKLIREYCGIYFSNISGYNFFFFITRILATIKKTFFTIV